MFPIEIKSLHFFVINWHDKYCRKTFLWYKIINISKDFLKIKTSKWTNKTDKIKLFLKRESERERNSGCLPAPGFSLCQSDCGRKFYTVQKAGPYELSCTTQAGLRKGARRACHEREKQTSEFCTISLLNAGLKFSEQSWILGGQTVWLTESLDSRRGPPEAPGTWTHTPGGHRGLPMSILQFCGKVLGLRSVCCWVLPGAHCLLTEFFCGEQEDTVGAATGLLPQSWVWVLTTSLTHTSEQDNRSKTEANL